MSGPSFQDPHALLNMIAFTVIQASHESARDLGSFESTPNNIIFGCTMYACIHQSTSQEQSTK